NASFSTASGSASMIASQARASRGGGSARGAGVGRPRQAPRRPSRSRAPRPRSPPLRARRGDPRAGHAARELGRVTPETPYAPRAGEAKACPRLTIDGILVGVRRRAVGRRDGGVEAADRLALRAGEPGGFGLGSGHGDEE